MGFGRLAGIRLQGILLFAAIAASFAALSPLVAQQQPAPTPKAKAAEKAADKDTSKTETTRTRFVIGLEKEVDFEVAALENPNRVFVDLPEVKLVLPEPLGNVPAGLIKSFRHGMSAPGKARVVIEVTGPVVVEKSVIEKGPDGKTARLSIDMVSAAEAHANAEARATMRAGALGLGAVGLQPPLPKPAVSPRVLAERAHKPVIVIDPGHGGHDPGAQKFGTVEKDVVLSFSLKLREKLNASGAYNVLMTRDTDVFVPLEERREFAERKKAALFIAIHADYTKRASARGATVYSLRPQLADALRKTAQNGVGEKLLSSADLAQVKEANGDVNTVKGFLSDLARLEVNLTRERTSSLVRSVVDFMGGSTNLMDNPDRGAAFVVLKTATMPSILIELGYVTNTEDAEQLKSDQWRDRVAGSIVTALDAYFAQLPRW
jgi:N-acetylmuramoyl-L-alanine amidase